jgi:hypothetical protein
MNGRILLSCAFAMAFSFSAARAGTFTGRAIGLDNGQVDDLTVSVENARGVALNPESNTKFPDGNYEVSVDDQIFVGKNPSVTIRFRAPGRQTVILNRVLGPSNQNISVVMPRIASLPAAAEPCEPCIPRRFRFWHRRWGCQ